MDRARGTTYGSSIGKLVKRNRTVRGLTQRELSEASGVRLSVLRDLEQGRTSCPRWETMESIAAALQLDGRQRTELVQACRPGVRREFQQAAADWGDAGPEVAQIHIGVLGPVAAWRQGTELSLGSLRQRAVLGLLALHHGTALPANAIIDAVWGIKQPASAVTQLQGYVCALRKLLGFDRGGGEPRPLIVTVGGGYRMETAVKELDAMAFGELVDRAGRAAAQLRLEHACYLYQQALKLWRGDVLADIDILGEEPIATELANQRSEVVMRLAQVAVRVGRPHDALPHLRELCTRDSLNEAAHACLITALAAGGQQAAALETFARLRERLDRELGVRPSPQLARAHLDVLRQQLPGMRQVTEPQLT